MYLPISCLGLKESVWIHKKKQKKQYWCLVGKSSLGRPNDHVDLRRDIWHKSNWAISWFDANHMLKPYHTPSNLFSLPRVWIAIRSPVRVEFGMYSSHLIDGITILTYRIFICLGIGCIKGFSKFIDGIHPNFLVCTSSTLKLSIQQSCYLSPVLPIYYRVP
jgi:hypothetical protein